MESNKTIFELLVSFARILDITSMLAHKVFKWSDSFVTPEDINLFAIRELRVLGVWVMLE